MPCNDECTLIIYISGPYTTPGKYGNAIFTPNTGKYDGNVIDLGRHENDCLGKLSLCPKGLTLSLWFKADPPSHVWPILFSSTHFTIYFELKGHLRLKALLQNGTHQIKYSTLAHIAPIVWTHLGITYIANSGFEFFHNGCKLTKPNPIVLPMTPVLKNFELGCAGGQKCMKVAYDDLRIWSSVKDEQFMWWLSKK